MGYDTSSITGRAVIQSMARDGSIGSTFNMKTDVLVAARIAATTFGTRIDFTLRRATSLFR